MLLANRSIIEAFIVGTGNYSLMWGQIREGKARDDHDNRNGDSRDNKVPLLQEETQV